MDAARIDPDILLSHADFVRALARSLLADAHAAEDVAQDALVAALDRPPRSERSLRSWLGRVTHNFARQSLRRQDRRGARERDSARAESLPGVDKLLEREAARAAVVRALLDLSEPTRSALILHYDEGLSARAIAARLSIPVETVRTRIRRGLARLRADLEERGGARDRGWMAALAPIAANSKAPGLQATPTWNALFASTAVKLGAAAVAAVVALVALRTLGGDGDPRAPVGPSAVPTLSRDADEKTQDASHGNLSSTSAVSAREESREAVAPPVRTAGSAATPAWRVSLLGRFVRPDHGALTLASAAVVLAGSRGSIREIAVADADTVRVGELEPDVYTVRVAGPGFDHRQQVFDLSKQPTRKPSEPSGADFEERIVLWPEGWIAVVVLTPDGRPFEEIADELHLERKCVLVDAFDVRTCFDEPNENVWGIEAIPRAAVWRAPPLYQSWALPGACVGSLQVRQPPPFWVALAVHGVPAGWEIVNPGDREVVFRLDARAFEDRLATVRLRVLDAPGGAPRLDVRVTLKADTSAHRRKDLTDLAPEGDGRVVLAHVVPGRYELSIEGGGALNQDLLEIEPGEKRDLGDIALPANTAVPVHVVDAEGKPAVGWVEIAPYRRGGNVSDLYPPNLHRGLDEEGNFSLPMPSQPSIVRVTLADPETHGQTNRLSANVLLDPRSPPPGRLELAVREPVLVRFDAATREGTRIEVLDDLGLVVATPRRWKDEGPRAELAPGRYLARRVDSHGDSLGAAAFEAVDSPLSVSLP